MVRNSWVLGVCLVVGACGGNDEPAAMKGTVNTPLAKSSVQQSLMVRMAADSMNGPAVASAVMALNGSASGIVQPSTPTAGALTSADIEQVAQAQTGSQMCDASGCKYDRYSTGGYTIDGTVTVGAPSGEAKNIKWDLTIKNAGTGTLGGFGFDYTGKGDINVSTTSLAGEVHTKSTVAGSQNGQSFTGGSDTTVKYMAVVITSGNPTGGSLYAKTVSFGSSGGQSATQAYEGTLSFAP
jgi:hypothetical protein